MSVSLSQFRPVAGGEATRIRLNDTGDGVIAKGTSLKGRAVAWVAETFGEGKAKNQATIRAFTEAVRTEYGDRAADAVGEQLRTRLEQGRPLSARQVERAIARAEQEVAAENRETARDLTTLTPGGPSAFRSLVDQVVARHGLDQRVADALLDPANAESSLLRELIRDSITGRGAELSHKPLEGQDAVALAEAEVLRAARRVETKLALADGIAALSGGGFAGEVAAVVQGAGMDDRVRTALADPTSPAGGRLVAAIRTAIDDAARQQAPVPLTLDQARTAARTAILDAARDVERRLAAVDRILDSPGVTRLAGDTARGLINDRMLAGRDPLALAGGPGDAAQLRAQVTADVLAMAAAPTDQQIEKAATSRLAARMTTDLIDAAFVRDGNGSSLANVAVAEFARRLGLPPALLAGKLTPQVLDDAKAEVLRDVGRYPLGFPGALEQRILQKLREAMADSLIEAAATDPQIGTALAGLRLRADSDSIDGRIQSVFLKELTERLLDGPLAQQGGPPIDAARRAIGRALVTEASALAGGTAAEKRIFDALSRSTFGTALYRTLDDASRITLREAQIARALEEFATGDSEPGTDSTIVGRMADLVTIRVRALRQEALAGQPPVQLSEADALRRLRDRDPAFVGRMDVVLATVAPEGRPPTQGAWLENRIALAEMRDRARDLAATPENAGNEVQRFITAGLREISTTMFAAALEAMGEPPPCDFAVLSLGSTARGEASPFSDMEFAILLPEDSTPQTLAYFQRLSALVRDQVYALGETGGAERNEGFHWDSALNPYNRPDEFIGSARQLVATHVSMTTADGFGRTMFTNAEWMTGGDALQGDGPDASWSLVQGLHREVAGRIATPDGQTGLTRGQSLGRWMIGEAVDMADSGLAGLGQGEVDVKALGRLPMMLAQGLALENGIVFDELGEASNSTVQRVDALVARGVMSRADGDALIDLQDRLSKIRVQGHFHADGGPLADTVRRDAGPSQPDGPLHLPPTEFDQLVADLRAFRDRAEAWVGAPGGPLQ